MASVQGQVQELAGHQSPKPGEQVWVLEWTGSQLSLPWEQAWEWVTAGHQLPLPEELARVQGNAECYLPGEWYRDWLGPNGTANRSRLRDRSWGWETGLGMETGREK